MSAASITQSPERYETWAAHPNPDLRMELARHIGRGWQVRAIGRRAALLIRSRRFSLPFAFVFGWLYVFLYVLLNLFRVTNAMLLWVEEGGTEVYRRRVPVPRGGPWNIDTSIVDRP